MSSETVVHLSVLIISRQLLFKNNNPCYVNIALPLFYEVFFPLLSDCFTCYNYEHMIFDFHLQYTNGMGGAMLLTTSSLLFN